MENGRLSRGLRHRWGIPAGRGSTAVACEWRCLKRIEAARQRTRNQIDPMAAILGKGGGRPWSMVHWERSQLKGAEVFRPNTEFSMRRPGRAALCSKSVLRQKVGNSPIDRPIRKRSPGKKRCAEPSWSRGPVGPARRTSSPLGVAVLVVGLPCNGEDQE